MDFFYCFSLFCDIQKTDLSNLVSINVIILLFFYFGIYLQNIVYSTSYHIISNFVNVSLLTSHCDRSPFNIRNSWILVDDGFRGFFGFTIIMTCTFHRVTYWSHHHCYVTSVIFGVWNYIINLKLWYISLYTVRY